MCFYVDSVMLILYQFCDRLKTNPVTPECLFSFVSSHVLPFEIMNKIYQNLSPSPAYLLQNLRHRICISSNVIFLYTEEFWRRQMRCYRRQSAQLWEKKNTKQNETNKVLATIPFAGKGSSF